MTEWPRLLADPMLRKGKTLSKFVPTEDIAKAVTMVFNLVR